MEGFIFSQSGQMIQEILTYVEQRLPGTLQALEKAIRDETTRATNKENELLGAIGGLIPKSEKGAANGVASLNAGGQVPNEQLQWSLRGVLNPSDIDSTSLVAGIYQVNGKVLGPGILDGEHANGVLLQFAWGSRVQVLYVGRAAGASAGEQVEIYTRRYLPTPMRWTAWSKAGGGSDDIFIAHVIKSGGSYTSTTTFQQIVEARAANKPICAILHESTIGPIGSTGTILFLTDINAESSATFSSLPFFQNSLYKMSCISWLFEDIILTYTSTIYGDMSKAEAEAGTAIDARTISAQRLKATILYHTSNLNSSNLLIVNGDGMEASHSSTEIAAAVTAGKMPVLKVGNKFFMLYSISNNAVFRMMDGLNIVAEYEINDQKQILESITVNSIGQIEDVHIFSPQEGQVLVYIPEHEEEETIVPAGWYNRTLSYPSMSQYEALVARVAALEQNQ